MSTNPSGFPSIETASLKAYVAEWLNDCDWRELSRATIALNRIILGGLVWFLETNGIAACGVGELRQFFAYVKHGHEQPGGRWGNPRLTSPPAARTQLDYFQRVRTFLTWCVDQGYIDRSPAERLKPPMYRPDQPEPFTDDQFDRLLDAAGRTQNAERDVLLVWMLYDLGLRSSEICGIARRHLDLPSRCVRVLGKGNKKRTVYFGKVITRLLWKYIAARDLADDDPLFQAETGSNKGGPLNKDSLGALFDRLKAKAQIKRSRCSPHTMRHTHALEFLHSPGARLDELMERLGHTDMTMTKRYVKLAEADLAAQSRYSPADRKKRR